jgi:hypothetical protein
VVEADKMSGLGGEGETGIVAEDMVREEDVKVRKRSGRKRRNEIKKANGRKERERQY